ncbi:MAG TPA: c-type cytochrome [Longimicrobiales bacterium]|nr:c-type cytochrome [Longimicrobiales bacterium]
MASAPPSAPSLPGAPRVKRPRAVRWLLWTLAGAAVVTAGAVAAVYAGSEWILRRARQAPLEPLPVLAAPADLAEGERLAKIVGCWAGCHGMQGEGDVEAAPGIFSAVAPTLSAVLPLYSDAELARLVRYGVKRDGRTAIGMISGTFHPLGDEDLARIVAHLRRQPASPPVERERRMTLLGRLALVTGRWQASADEVDRAQPRWGNLPRRTPFEQGRYLVSITCTECHGFDLRGEAFEGSPSLAVVAAYRPEQFRHLLRTGEPLDGRDLGLMSWVAKNGFAHFTDAESDAIHAYLRAYHLEGRR